MYLILIDNAKLFPNVFVPVSTPNGSIFQLFHILISIWYDHFLNFSILSTVLCYAFLF